MSQLDDLLERTLTEHAARAPGGDGVADRVLASAPVRRWTRWGVTMLAGLAAAGVVVAAVLVLPGDRTSSGADVASDPTAGDPATEQAVRYRGVQITVPADWTTWPGGEICRGIHATVLLQTSGRSMEPVQDDSCVLRPGSAWVQLLTVPSGRVGFGTERDIVIDGAAARVGVRSATWCPPQAGCIAAPARDDARIGYLGVPGRDVSIQVYASDPDFVRRILASAELVDMSDVVVPDVVGMSWPEAAEKLVALGLAPERAGEDAGGLVTGTTPAPGEPAPADGTVRVRLARGSPVGE